jgi:hypothetical protein
MRDGTAGGILTTRLGIPGIPTPSQGFQDRVDFRLGEAPALGRHGGADARDSRGRDHRVLSAEGIRHFYERKRHEVEAHSLYFPTVTTP